MSLGEVFRTLETRSRSSKRAWLVCEVLESFCSRLISDGLCNRPCGLEQIMRGCFHLMVPNTHHVLVKQKHYNNSKMNSYSLIVFTRAEVELKI